MTRRFLTVLLGALLTLLTLTACSHDTGSAKKKKPVASPSASAVVHYSPLTGEPLAHVPGTPVFAVKIDNTDHSRPQIGIDRADLVVEELVEGGLTRLAALYYTDLPTTVGHVRSVRATDIGIASPVSAQVIASGGAPVTLGRLKQAGLTVRTEDAGTVGFSSDPSLSRPYNRLVNLATVARGQSAGSIGSYLQWATAGTTASTGDARATTASVRFSGVHTTRWQYAHGAWRRTNGTSQKEFAATNLLVLYAGQADAGYKDPAGNPVPETTFTGTGDAVMFLGDQVVRGTWHKDSDASTIELSTTSGSQVTLKPGKVWIELAPQGQGTASWN